MRSKLGTANVFATLILFFAICDHTAAQTSDDGIGSIYSLPAGTRVRLRMEGTIGSAFSSVNDTFLARVALPVVIREVTLLPVGTLVEGRVTGVSPAAIGNRPGHIDVHIETLRLSGGIARAIDAVPIAPLGAKQPNSFWPIFGGSVIGAAIGLAAASGRGALIGAGLGGAAGAGASYSRKGRDVRLKEDDVFEIELKKEVVLPVLDY